MEILRLFGSKTLLHVNFIARYDYTLNLRNKLGHNESIKYS